MDKSTSKDESGSMFVQSQLKEMQEFDPECNINNPSIRKAASILVIDDNYFNLVAAKILLGEFGLSCDIAISGKKGIKLVKQRLDSLLIDPEGTKPL